jgi:hypothetical protein
MNKVLGDGNILGRVGALALIAAVGYGLHRLGCGGGMCPAMKTDSCCAGAASKADAPAPAVPTPAK